MSVGVGSSVARRFESVRQSVTRGMALQWKAHGHGHIYLVVVENESILETVLYHVVSKDEGKQEICKCPPSKKVVSIIDSVRAGWRQMLDNGVGLSAG